MSVIAWVPMLGAVLSAALYVVIKQPDGKQLAGWSFLASMIALMMSLSAHVVRLGAAP